MWLAKGDTNTAYFHNNMKDRYNKNKILSLELEDGQRVFDMQQIHQLCNTFRSFSNTK